MRPSPRRGTRQPERKQRHDAIGVGQNAEAPACVLGHEAHDAVDLLVGLGQSRKQNGSCARAGIAPCI